jgi:mono/diheme cytochrome c family protein
MSFNASFRAALRVAALGLVCAAPLPLHASDSPKPGISDGMHFSEQDGEGLYRAICQGCHMPDGQGAQGAGMYPALAKNPRLAASAYPVLNVLNGLRGMPMFKAYLSDEQVAAVVNYVRTNMGNKYKDPVTAASVKALRR